MQTEDTAGTIAESTTSEPVVVTADKLARAVDARLGGGPSDHDEIPKVLDGEELPAVKTKSTKTRRRTSVPAPEGTTAASDAAVTTEPTMSTTKAKAKKTTKKAKTALKAKVVKAPKGPGVIDTIARMMQRSNGASKAEIHAELVKRFPDRDGDALLTTASLQVNRLPKERKLKVTKEKSDKRGLVYYLAEKK